MEQAVNLFKNQQNLRPKPRRLTSFVIILVIVSGIVSALFAGITVDLRSREYLQGRAQTIADTLPADLISSLDGELADAETPAYKEIKPLLERVKSNNLDLKFVYLMQQRGQEQIFLVDASDPDSDQFSPPGEIYTEGTEQLRSGFASNRPFVEGPSRDHWGVWLSAFAPVTDPKTNHIVAWVGLDTPAINYYFEVAIYGLVPLCLAAIPLAGLLRDRKLENKEHEIGELKRQFVSIASHELRSPLTGMLWAVQSLLKTGDKNMTKQQRQLLLDMFQSAQASISTINEILDLSVFERNQTGTLQQVDVDLVSILKEVQKTLSLGAQEKRLTINLDHLPKTALAKGDVAALRRAMMNIVSNSIKYAFEGSAIQIKLAQKDQEYTISVQDHGIGIPQTEQAKVLEGYHRATNANQVQAHGTGLGLWVTRLIIEEHGGRLWLTSVENEGTTVFVALPKTKPAGQPAIKPV